MTSKIYCILILTAWPIISFSSEIEICNSVLNQSRQSKVTNDKLILPANLINLPNLRQSKSYTCGVCALQSILYYYQVFNGREDQLAAQLNTTEEQGTSPEDIFRVAAYYNLNPQILQNAQNQQLEEEIDNGRPVMLVLQAGSLPPKSQNFASVWDQGHWVVLIGYDENNYYLMDPSSAPPHLTLVSKEELVERWHDYRIEEKVKVYNRLAITFEKTMPKDTFRLLEL